MDRQKGGKSTAAGPSSLPDGGKTIKNSKNNISSDNDKTNSRGIGGGDQNKVGKEKSNVASNNNAKYSSKVGVEE